MFYPKLRWSSTFFSLTLGLIGLLPMEFPIVSGADYYVSPTGSDQELGTLEHPWKSVLRAVAATGPGDTVYVRGGTYDEGEVWIRDVEGRGGAPGRLLRIAAYPGETPTFVNASRPFIVDADYVRVEGLHMRNGKSIDIWGNNRTDVQLVNNSFQGSGYGYDAISTSGNNILLEGNVCDIEGNSVGTQGHCYYIHHGKNIVVRNNVARGMTGYGIHVFDQRRSEDAADFQRVIQDVVIEGNITYESEQRAGIVIAASDGARVENVTIRNNIVHNNRGSGIVIRSRAQGIRIEHNTVTNNGDDALSIGGTEPLEQVLVRNNIFDLGSHTDTLHVWNERTNQNDSTIVLENNLYGPGLAQLYQISDSQPLTGDPGFVDEAQRNFHLKSTSAALNRAIPSNDVPTDRDGTPRPQGTGSDLGAFELQLVRRTGDANEDNQVDFADFLILSAHFGAPGEWRDGDFNANGTVDFADFTLLSAHFDEPTPQPATTMSLPEPTGLAGMATLMAVFAMTRRPFRRLVG